MAERDRRKLNKLIKRASSVLDCPLDPIEQVGEENKEQHLPPPACDGMGSEQFIQQQTFTPAE